jgi:hypothetical protein
MADQPQTPQTMKAGLGPPMPGNFLHFGKLDVSKKMVAYGAVAALGAGALGLAKEIGTNVASERVIRRFPRLVESRMKMRQAPPLENTKYRKFLTKMQAVRTIQKQKGQGLGGAGEPRDDHGRWTTGG